MKVVLGAGIAGLGAFYADNSCELFEMNDIAGGLCRGFDLNGFHFDNAVHLSFTNDSFVRNIFDKVDYYSYNPKPYSWFKSRWLRHPAQNNLFNCDVDDKINAIKSFLVREEDQTVDDFASWTKKQYGEWLFNNMFKPYNEKYWCVSLEELGINWIENRIYKPTLDEILYGAFTDETPNTYYAKEMRYPKEGGYFNFIKEIVESAEKEKKIHYRKRAKSIDYKNRVITFEDGKIITYSELYSSIPLNEITQLVSGIPRELQEKAKSLEYTGVALVSIGFNRIIECEKLWFYFYDKDILAARAYLPSLKSVKNTPQNCSSIQFEIYFNSKEEIPTEKICVKNCLYTLKKIGIATERDIVCIDYRIVDYANVIFRKDSEQIADEIKEWLRGKGIIPIGRFGEWKYFWSDQAFLSGYNAVKKGNIK